MNYNFKNVLIPFEKMAIHQPPHSAFQSILDFSLTAHRYYPTREELQTVHEKMTTWPDKEHITAFLNALADLMPQHFVDPLGEFYMHHISHGRLGQYFTPETITDFTTHSLISATTEPGQRVVDPACGSGRFLLSAAKINRHLLFYGADLDPICCKMAVLNMLFNSLSGEIAHMNTITNTFYRGYHLHTKLIDGYHHPYFIEFTEPEKSYIWLHPTAKK